MYNLQQVCHAHAGHTQCIKIIARLLVDSRFVARFNFYVI